MKLLEKLIKAAREKRLLRAVYSNLKPTLYGLKWVFYSPGSKAIRIHCPEYVEPSKDNTELQLVNRIFASFKKMKQDQQKASGLYRPSSFWQKHLDEAYSYLLNGLKENDINKFHFFLANFGAWKAYHAVEATTLLRANARFFLHRRYLINDIFLRQLKVWKWFYNNRKPIARLSYPQYGNQGGAYIDGKFVGVGSFFTEIHADILSNIIKGAKRPVVAELGAGYGKLAYFTLRDFKDFAFIDFDLPETLCLAAYYLMKAWPDKKALLYGEDNFNGESHKKYDLIFMPSFEIEKTAGSSIDLFINKNSLGEMDKEAANNYVRRICECAKYFFHLNHDNFANIYAGNKRGPLGYEYPVPMDKFRLLFRYPDIGHMLYLGGLDFNMDIFIYLYERINA